MSDAENYWQGLLDHMAQPSPSGEHLSDTQQGKILRYVLKRSCPSCKEASDLAAQLDHEGHQRLARDMHAAIARRQSAEIRSRFAAGAA